MFLLPAIVAQNNLSAPIMVISEDARQLAVITEGGDLIVNRARPNGFILDQWKAAYKSQHVLKPGSANGFTCQNRDYCSYSRLINNIKYELLYIENNEYYHSNKTEICSEYKIVILAFAPAPTTCDFLRTAERTPHIITAQQLALYGSAEIRPDPNDNNSYLVQFALGEASRPWQSHRKFSRSARNLAPFKPSNQ